MKRIILTALITCIAFGTAAAQSCDSQAVNANGKPLHGSAKMSFVRECKPLMISRARLQCLLLVTYTG